MTESGEVILKSIHVNPSYFYSETDLLNHKILKKDKTQTLNHGDAFSLLQGAYKFKVFIEDGEAPAEVKATIQSVSQTNGSEVKNGSTSAAVAENGSSKEDLDSPVKSAEAKKEDGKVDGKKKPAVSKKPAKKAKNDDDSGDDFKEDEEEEDNDDGDEDYEEEDEDSPKKKKAAPKKGRPARASPKKPAAKKTVYKDYDSEDEDSAQEEEDQSSDDYKPGKGSESDSDWEAERKSSRKTSRGKKSKYVDSEDEESDEEWGRKKKRKTVSKRGAKKRSPPKRKSSRNTGRRRDDSDEEEEEELSDIPSEEDSEDEKPKRGKKTAVSPRGRPKREAAKKGECQLGQNVPQCLMNLFTLIRKPEEEGSR